MAREMMEFCSVSILIIWPVTEVMEPTSSGLSNGDPTSTAIH
jgi:hypothetical protein